jgi:hypothetical protein
MMEYLTEENSNLIFYEVSPSKTYTSMLSSVYPGIEKSKCMTTYSVAETIAKLIINKEFNESGSVFHLKLDDKSV